MGLRISVDAAIQKSIQKQEMKWVVIGLLLIFTVQAVFSFFRIYFFEIVSQRAMADLRKDLYEKIITQPVPFFEQTRIGELSSRISNDVTQLQESLSLNLAMLVRQLLLPIISIPRLFVISPKLTLIMISTFPPLILVSVFFGRFIRKQSKKTQDAVAATNTVVEETFQANDVVKSFTNEFYELQRYSQLLQENTRIALFASRYRAAFVSFIIFAFSACIMLIIGQGLNMVYSRQLEMGSLIEFLVFTIVIGTSLGGLSESFAVLQKTIGASSRIREILNQPAEVSAERITIKPNIRGEVDFRGVSFAYPSRPETTVCRDITFHVVPGMKVALVGASGSGKSTLIKLLMGYYKDWKGDISIDGIPLQDYNLSSMRSVMGVVPQDTMLFGGTIEENIRYGNIQADEKEVKSAAEKANAWQFIEQFPDGLKTIVGERGVKLSGGQRQRIAIARALLRNPAILLLDEATSALDSESEQLVKQALKELMQNRTSFIIAHRLSTIREADLILVLHKGKIAEKGTHAELMQCGGVYSHLVSLQLDMAS